VICVLFEFKKLPTQPSFWKRFSRASRIGEVSNTEVGSMAESVGRRKAGPLISPLPVRPVSVGRILFALVAEPSRDVARCNGSSWQMRIESAGVDDQPLVEFRARELPGFLFGFKYLACAWASPSLHRAAFVHFKCDIPGKRHLAPKDVATGHVSVSALPLKAGQRSLLAIERARLLISAMVRIVPRVVAT